jgi:hypothetical protein
MSPLHLRPCPRPSFVYRWLNIFFVSFVQLFDHLLGFSFVQEENRSKKKKRKQPTGHTNNKVTCALPPILSSPVVKCVYSASTELYVCSKKKTNETRIMKKTRARYKNEK